MNHFFSQARLLPSTGYRYLNDLIRHGEAYRDHAVVWQLFPGDGLERDFLFRAEQHEGGVRYYIVSQREPVPVPGLLELRTKPYTPALKSGEWLQFDLRANPVVARRDEAGRSSRHDVWMDAKKNATGDGGAPDLAARQWLLQRAGQWGLTVDTSNLQVDIYRKHRLRHKGRDIRFSSLDYRGVARVEDAELLRRSLLQGVGKARGFGCGLLLVKRLG